MKQKMKGRKYKIKKNRKISGEKETVLICGNRKSLDVKQNTTETTFPSAQTNKI